MLCVGCGGDVEPHFRFCPQCGRPVGGEVHDAVPPPAGERKLVTVLFCDLKGSTEIAARLDPEEFGDLLDEYIGLAFAEVYRLDGYVNRLAGDGFMALFGAPVAHEDAPERAARAALAIQEALANRATAAEPLLARIGIHTGPVVVGAVGTDRRMDYTAVGDTTNLAARLETCAAPGTILMSEATYRLLRGRVRVEPLGPLVVKGKSEPVPAYQLLEFVHGAGAMEAAAERGMTPFVGRDAELARLDSAFAAAAGGGRQVVTITGDAGSGKSRLVWEFRERLPADPISIFEGRCAAVNQATPYHAFLSMFRRHHGITPGDSVTAACERVEERFGPWSPEQREVNRALIGYLVRSSPQAGALSGDELKRAIFSTIEEVLRSRSRQGPVVVVVEDLHWIDPVSRELLELLVGRLTDAPILFVLTHRPADQPIWHPKVPVTQIALHRLSDEHVAQILRSVACGALPPDLERRLIQRAAGSPFFAEELTRGLLESGALVCENGACRLTSPGQNLPVPETVQEVVAARLDRLPPATKRVVQVAAVLGRQFSPRLLAMLLADERIEVVVALDELERRGLVHRKGVLGGDELRFGESLTQEIAYESLLMKQRRLLHERVGQLLEADESQAGAERAVLLAHHYARSDNRRKAVGALLVAAAEADRTPSYDTAARLYRQAWELGEAEQAAHPDPAGERQVYEAVRGLCRVYALFGIGDPVDAPRILDRARALAEHLDDREHLPALRYYEGLVLMVRGGDDFARGLTVAEEGFAIAQREGNVSAALAVSRGLCFGYVADGRFELASRTIDWVLHEGARGQRTEQPSDFQLAARWVRQVVLFASDEFSAAATDALETWELARRAPNRTVQCVVASTLCHIHFMRGEYAEARRWADSSLGTAEAIGNVAAYPSAASVALAARAALGEPVIASPYLDQIEQGLAAAGPAQINFRFLADAYLAGNDLDRAERVCGALHERVGGRYRRALSGIAMGEIALRHGPGRIEAASRHFGEALGIAEALGARSALAGAVLGVAEVATARGDHAGAQRALERARSGARELGLRHYLPRILRLEESLPAGQQSA